MQRRPHEDPNTVPIPVVSLSPEEIEEAEKGIAAGTYPADFFERHAAAMRKNIFGHDHKTDRAGKPIEQGLGSASNQTAQSVDAYRRWCKDEPDYERNLSRMEKELAASNERRGAERVARRAAAAAR